jgi:probable selenium-dependent hydroxylase accessory protein YqeC
MRPTRDPAIERNVSETADSRQAHSPWQPVPGPTPLLQLLEIERGSTVAVMGAGGKHTLMAWLQHELSATGQAALLTSSTNLHRPSGNREPDLLLAERDRDWRPQVARRIVAGQPVYLLQHEMGRGMLKGLSLDELAALRQEHPDAVIVVKTDGARKRSFKAPAPHEPVVPPFADVCVVIVGIDCVGRHLDEQCVHRPERVADLAGVTMGEVLTTQLLARVIAHAGWYSSRLPSAARRVLYLSKVSTPQQRRQALDVFQHVPDAAFLVRAAGDTPRGKVERFCPARGA